MNNEAPLNIPYLLIGKGNKTQKRWLYLMDDHIERQKIVILQLFKVQKKAFEHKHSLVYQMYYSSETRLESQDFNFSQYNYIIKKIKNSSLLIIPKLKKKKNILFRLNSSPNSRDFQPNTKTNLDMSNIVVAHPLHIFFGLLRATHIKFSSTYFFYAYKTFHMQSIPFFMPMRPLITNISTNSLHKTTTRA